VITRAAAGIIARYAISPRRDLFLRFANEALRDHRQTRLAALAQKGIHVA
jgi:hypothetical protein